MSNAQRFQTEKAVRQLIERSTTGPAFRRQLPTDARAALAEYTDQAVPADVTISRSRFS